MSMPVRTAGEDAAVFDPASQSTQSWVAFTAVLAVVLAILYQVLHTARCSEACRDACARTISMQDPPCHSGRGMWHVR